MSWVRVPSLAYTAGIVQLVEHLLAKEKVTSSSLVARSKIEAEVAELADAHDSNSCSFGSVGSIPSFGIIFSFRWLRSLYRSLLIPLLPVVASQVTYTNRSHAQFYRDHGHLLQLENLGSQR